MMDGETQIHTTAALSPTVLIDKLSTLKKRGKSEIKDAGA